MLTGKLFVVPEQASLTDIAARLQGFRLEEPFEAGDVKLTLVTEIKDLSMAGNRLSGKLSRDTVLFLNQRGTLVPALRTREAFFSFHEYRGRVLLLILEKKFRANMLANLLSKILFVKVGSIVEARIPPEALKAYHDTNAEDTKVVYFDDLDVPNVSKMALYGSLLKETSLFGEYLKHGLLWYTVVRSNRFGYVVGVTRNGIVVVFNRIELEEYVNFIANEIFPLISLP
ncbi:MAG: hypothetical protein C4339_03805 [Nitrososphaerota archaeon]